MSGFQLIEFRFDVVHYFDVHLLNGKTTDKKRYGIDITGPGCSSFGNGAMTELVHSEIIRTVSLFTEISTHGISVNKPASSNPTNFFIVVAQSLL